MSTIRPLPGPEIYEGIEALNLPDDLQGWHSTHPIFAQLIEEVKPLNILEVGSWKGASAIHMANLAPLAIVTACDTWLGGADHELNQQVETSVLPREHGYPRLYFQFLHNVAKAGLQKRIRPIPQTSLNGARLLKAHAYTAQLCYIDGSHEYSDVFADIEAYWPLVEDGGILFGDDFAFPGVQAAVIRFIAENELWSRVKVEVNNFWVIRK